MKTGVTSYQDRVWVALVAGWLLAIAVGTCSSPALAQTEEPIAYIGHGAFFDSKGNEIQMTQEFVAGAQAWYRTELLSGLDESKKRELSAFEKRLYGGVDMKGQTRLVVQQRTLQWLFFKSPKHQENDRMLGKLRALDYALTWKLPERAGQKPGERREEFKLDPDLLKKLASKDFKPDSGVHVLSVTTNLGQAYINECMAGRVPIPPTIGVLDPTGTAGWKSQGFIPTGDQFIVATPAEVRTYQSTSPAGMCYALPRYSDATKSTVSLDGVICLSQETSKACFWDNQMMGSGFSFPAGTQIPIGVANTAIDPQGRYQAGGFELLGGSGGVCTDCHAGENPYITHPKSVLATGVLWEDLRNVQNLPTFAPNRYDPLVAASWPQNQSSQAGGTVPAVCVGCHIKGVAGRFPHLSNELNGLSGYCKTILTQGYTRTMPPSSPGSQVAAGQAFRDAWCNDPPNAASEDTGDPHLTTTNGIRYDFQSAGEFVALKNSDTGFEVQARQSPVQTTFTPPANPYTGLASCVSLNTAVAMRVGKHRVTYQPIPGSAGSVEQLQLRIDGRLVTSSTSPIDLGGGNALTTSSSGGVLTVKISDGTSLTVTPVFWASEGYWYLDITVSNTTAREGTMGPVLAGDWLPRAPDSTSFGPMPASLHARHVVLNQIFANAWRVTNTTTLFDYPIGISTADFTDNNWPPESGQPCRTSLPSNRPLTRMQPELARAVCRGIRNKARLANCIFDVTVMGDKGVAKGYINADQAKTPKLARQAQ